jgi:prevent-host-death family protein
MKLRTDVKPITYLKNHAADLVESVATRRQTMVITQHGEPKAVVMDVETYDRMQTAMALMKMINHSKAAIRDGHFLPLEAAFDRAERRADEKTGRKPEPKRRHA